MALIVRVCTLLLRLTATVLPARLAGLLMFDPGRDSTSNVPGPHVAASITSWNGGLAGVLAAAWMKETLLAPPIMLIWPLAIIGMARVLCTTCLIVTCRPTLAKRPSSAAIYRPTLSTTGRAPTVML